MSPRVWLTQAASKGGRRVLLGGFQRMSVNVWRIGTISNTSLRTHLPYFCEKLMTRLSVGKVCVIYSLLAKCLNVAPLRLVQL